MSAQSRWLRPRVIGLAILVGIVFETGVFFLALLLSGTYLLATLATLALLVVILATALVGSRRAGRRRTVGVGPESAFLGTPLELPGRQSPEKAPATELPRRD